MRAHYFDRQPDNKINAPTLQTWFGSRKALQIDDVFVVQNIVALVGFTV